MKTGAITDIWRVLTLLMGFLFGIYVAVFLHKCGHALGAEHGPLGRCLCCGFRDRGPSCALLQGT